MPYYAVPGNQGTIAAGYKTAAQVNATGATKRIKVYELMVGPTGAPNATDCSIQFDVSRITATGAGAYTTWTPTLLDPADGAAVSVAGINATAEATAITANSSLWNEGVNQRNSLRWVAPQESQYLIAPATLSNGFVLRALSATYTSSVSGQITFQE
jgi:hypothetical protein